MSTDLAALQSRISSLTAAQPFAVHWQIRALTAPGDRASEAEAVEGGVIGAGAQTQLAAFSTRKVSLLLACLALVHRGDLHLDQRLAVTEEMKDGVQAGIMKNMAPGVELSLGDHLRQMMITSDNICTQLVFEAIGQVTGAALQWVNDYCSWVGMRATIHREIFPRSGDLAWHHSIEHMTVTSPGDQAHLLALLGRGTHDADGDAAAWLHLTPELCRFAVDLMRQIYTPLLGARAAGLQFAEKNGRGLRGLSQVGLAATADAVPVAAVAVYAENIPTQLPGGTPGRIAAYDLFAAIGQAVEEWHLASDSESDQGQASRPAGAASPGPMRTGPPQPGSLPAAAVAAAQPPAAWATKTLTPGETTRQASRERSRTHPLAGTGKLFAAAALAERAEREPTLLQAPVTITNTHRSHAAAGPLCTHTGDLTLTLGDALGLIIGTSDAATSLAVREALDHQQVDLVAETQSLLTQLGGVGAESANAALTRTELPHTTLPNAALTHTSITGIEESAHAQGDLLVGQTTPKDLLNLLSLLASAGGLRPGLTGSMATDLRGDLAGGVAVDRHSDQQDANAPGENPGGISDGAARQVLSWMSQVFEPAGLIYALPGYGPKKVPQWSVSGLELRSPSSSVGSSILTPQGWTSVMIARTPGDGLGDGGSGGEEVVFAAAHLPAGTPESPHTGRGMAQRLGALGLAAYRGEE